MAVNVLIMLMDTIVSVTTRATPEVNVKPVSVKYHRYFISPSHNHMEKTAKDEGRVSRSVEVVTTPENFNSQF